MSVNILELLDICFEKDYILYNSSISELYYEKNLSSLKLIKYFNIINNQNINELLDLIKLLSIKFNIKFETYFSANTINMNSKIEDLPLIITIKNNSEICKLWKNKKIKGYQTDQLIHYSCRCLDLFISFN